MRRTWRAMVAGCVAALVTLTTAANARAGEPAGAGCYEPATPHGEHLVLVGRCRIEAVRDALAESERRERVLRADVAVEVARRESCERSLAASSALADMPAPSTGVEWWHVALMVVAGVGAGVAVGYAAASSGR